MPTGRPPTGTSFTNLFSNMRLSFAIYFPPAEPIFAVVFFCFCPPRSQENQLFGSSPMRTTMAVTLSAPPCSFASSMRRSDALHVAAFRFGGGENAAADLFGDERVIAGQLLEAAAAK